LRLPALQGTFTCPPEFPDASRQSFRTPQFTAEQKAALLRSHYVDKVPISKLCEENDLQPSLFYYWQKQFFENAAAALQPAAAAPRSTELEAKVATLEKQLAKKDEVIAWVTEEHVKLKKTLGEP
jgi:transposase